MSISDSNTPVQRHLTVKLNAGANTLAFLAAHNGRNKLYNYYGPMDTIDAKGISGTVTLSSPPSQAVDITQIPLAGRRPGNGGRREDGRAGPGHDRRRLA